jgi:hypothetical protein
MQAQAQGIARLAKDHQVLYEEARELMLKAREATQVLMREGLIPSVPKAE